MASVNADRGLQDFKTFIRDARALQPLHYSKRYDVDHPDGKQYYVEGSTCEIPRRIGEEMQDDFDHGYWTSSFPWDTPERFMR